MPTWIVIGLLLVAGCTLSVERQTGLGTWTKARTTQETTDRDSYECEQEARHPSYEDPSLQRGVLQSVMRMEPEDYAACMKARGYRQVVLTPSAAPPRDR